MKYKSLEIFGTHFLYAKGNKNKFKIIVDVDKYFHETAFVFTLKQ